MSEIALRKLILRAGDLHDFVERNGAQGWFEDVTV